LVPRAHRNRRDTWLPHGPAAGGFLRARPLRPLRDPLEELGAAAVVASIVFGRQGGPEDLVDPDRQGASLSAGVRFPRSARPILEDAKQPAYSAGGRSNICHQNSLALLGMRQLGDFRSGRHRHFAALDGPDELQGRPCREPDGRATERSPTFRSSAALARVITNMPIGISAAVCPCVSVSSLAPTIDRWLSSKRLRRILALVTFSRHIKQLVSRTCVSTFGRSVLRRNVKGGNRCKSC
jgi:hypothetical protein